MVSKKIVLVGDFAIGKTSLIRRFVDNEFSDNYLSTVGVKISRKNVTVDSKEVQNIIWDIEGATENKPIIKSYLLGSHGAIVVADVKREETIENLQNHIDTITNAAAKIPIVVALNKVDLLNEDEAKSVRKRVESMLLPTYHIQLTSAKTGEGVEEIFMQLSKLMVK